MRRIILAVIALLALAIAPSAASATIGPDSSSARTSSMGEQRRHRVRLVGTSYSVQPAQQRQPRGQRLVGRRPTTPPGLGRDRVGQSENIQPHPRADDNHQGRTYGRIRIQYWSGGAWADVVGRSGQDNRSINWRRPTERNGNEAKAWDFATPITADQRSASCSRRAIPPAGHCWRRSPPTTATATASSQARRSPASPRSAPTERSTAPPRPPSIAQQRPLSGQRRQQRQKRVRHQPGYWNDNTNGVWPDWVQINYGAPADDQQNHRRGSRSRAEASRSARSRSGRTRIQYYDDATSTWVDVTGATGQPNPIADWQGPIETYDGSESRSFDLATPVTTTKIRALIEDGSTDGWSWLDELTAYSGEDCHPPYPPTERTSTSR